MMLTAGNPISRVPALVTRLVAVRVFLTLSKIRSTPFLKTATSERSALKPLITRIPPSDSVRRPVTSALTLARSRKIGRTYPKAFREIRPNRASGATT